MDTATLVGGNMPKARIKRDYSKLKERQLEVSKSTEFIEKGGQVRDDNPPGYTQRTYAELAKIKMPMILDTITDENGNPRKAWTINEILAAMAPSITAIAIKYARKRAAFQMDEAISLGQETVLVTAWTDKGLAWFAGYCYDKIEAAIKRGAKTSGTIRAGEGRNEYRDKVQSIDEIFGEGEGTLAEIINESNPIVSRERCGDYFKLTLQERIVIIKTSLKAMKLPNEAIDNALAIIAEQVKKMDFSDPSAKADNQRAYREIDQRLKTLLGKIAHKTLMFKYLPDGARKLNVKSVKGATDAIFSRCCQRGMLPDGQRCTRCGGTGLLTIREERVVLSPAEIIDKSEKSSEFRRVFETLTGSLSEESGMKHKDILILKEGLDEEGGTPRDISDVAAIMRNRSRLNNLKTRIERIKKINELIVSPPDPQECFKLIGDMETKVTRVPKVDDVIQLYIAQRRKDIESIRTFRGLGSKNRVAHILENAKARMQSAQAKSVTLTEAIDRILDEE